MKNKKILAVVSLFIILGLAGALSYKSGLLPESHRSSLSDRAIETRLAIQQGNFARANELAGEVVYKSEIKEFHYSPLDKFMEVMIPKNDPAFLGFLDKWVETNPESPVPYLCRGEYYFNAAWTARGKKFINETSEAGFVKFIDYTIKAGRDMAKAIKIAPDLAYAYVRLLETISYQPNSNIDSQKFFEHAIARFPNYYPLYSFRLQQLMPRWSGTKEEMVDFTKKYTTDLPEGSSLKFLRFELYQLLLAEASLSFNDDYEWQKYLNKFLNTPSVENNIKDVLQLQKTMDPYQFNEFFIETLTAINRTPSFKFLSLKTLDLSKDIIGENSYTFNFVTAHFIYHGMMDTKNNAIEKKINYDSALKYYKKALAAAETFNFPNNDLKNERLAEIYNQLAHTSEKLENYQEAVKYGEAGIALNNKHKNLLVVTCESYREIKEFDKAIKTCTSALELQEDVYARFWRGWTYWEMKQPELAAKDIETGLPMADDDLKRRMLIMLANTYGDQKKFQEAINVYDNNPQILNAEKDRNNTANGYNNLCYYYMELKQDKKALDMCNKSLAIKDSDFVRQKQQQLIARLK